MSRGRSVGCTRTFPATEAIQSESLWAEVVSAPETKNQLVNTVHGALRTYDLPELVELAGKARVMIERPVETHGGEDKRRLHQTIVLR